MATPSIYPTQYSGTDRDYLHTKVDRDGCTRLQYVTVSVPAGTTSGTVVGLAPFNAGFRLSYGSKLHVEDLDTASSVTLDIGYIYDDTATYTGVADAFASDITTAQAGGLITFDEAAGLSFVAEANGWIVVTTGGASTGTTGAISGQLLGCYDGLSASN